MVIMGSFNFPLLLASVFPEPRWKAREDKGDWFPPQTGIAPLPDEYGNNCGQIPTLQAVKVYLKQC